MSLSDNSNDFLSGREQGYGIKIQPDILDKVTKNNQGPALFNNAAKTYLTNLFYLMN